MPAVSTAFAVGTTAVLLTDSAGGNYKSPYRIHNAGTPAVYIGGADVTAANGMPLASGAALEIEVDNGRDELYAIAAAAGGDVRVLRTVD